MRNRIRALRLQRMAERAEELAIEHEIWLLDKQTELYLEGGRENNEILTSLGYSPV